VKDTLAHIAWWARRASQVILAVTNGHDPEYSLEESDVEGINQQVYAECVAHSLSEVRVDEMNTYRSLLELTESLDANVLEDPHRFAWTKDAPLSVVVEWNTFGHYEEHMHDLKKALVK